MERLTYIYPLKLSRAIYLRDDSELKRDFREQGFGLLEVLLSLGISMIMMLAMVGYMQSQFTALRYVEKKFIALDLERTLTAGFSVGDLCTRNFLNQEFSPDPALNAAQPLEPIGRKIVYPPPDNSVIVQQDSYVTGSFNKLQAGKLFVDSFNTIISDSLYSAKFQIEFNNSSRETPIAPLKFTVFFSTVNSGFSRQKIVSCNTNVVTAAQICSGMGGTWNSTLNRCDPIPLIQGWMSPGYNSIGDIANMPQSSSTGCLSGTRMATISEVSRELANLSKFGRTLRDIIPGMPAVPHVVAFGNISGNFTISRTARETWAQTQGGFEMGMFKPGQNDIVVQDYLGGAAPALCVSNSNPIPPTP